VCVCVQICIVGLNEMRASIVVGPKLFSVIEINRCSHRLLYDTMSNLIDFMKQQFILLEASSENENQAWHVIARQNKG